jgi:antitoxin (DNA-binding transcriptional repressor) of toxin-antitoxin stability system
MIATVEQTQSELLRLIDLAQKGEEVVIVNKGRQVARLTPLPESRPKPNRQAWLAQLAELRTRVATDKNGLTIEQILDEDRGV